MNWEFSRYLLFFLFGFLMISAKEDYFDSLETVNVTVMTPVLSLVWFLSSESFGVPGVMEGGWVTEGHQAFSMATAVASLLQSFHAWFWCLLIFSWASRLLNKPNRWLPYLNQSVYPAYILHMTPTWILIVILSILGTNYYIGLVIGTLVVTGIVSIPLRIHQEGERLQDGFRGEGWVEGGVENMALYIDKGQRDSNRSFGILQHTSIRLDRPVVSDWA